MTENNHSNHFVTVLIVHYSHETAIIRGRLEAEGIECNLVDELTVQVNPLYSNAVGGVKLQVRESDFEKTYNILKEGGYVTDSDFENPTPKLITVLDKYTSKIPFIKGFRFEMRIIILVSVLVGLATTIFHFATLPSVSERIVKNQWCFDEVIYNNESYPTKTNIWLKISGGGYCDEGMDFHENGVVKLPGFNSSSVYANWILFGDSIEISKSDTFDFIYDGVYHIDFTDNRLLMNSKTTTMNGKAARLGY